MPKVIKRYPGQSVQVGDTVFHFKRLNGREVTLVVASEEPIVWDNERRDMCPGPGEMNGPSSVRNSDG